MKTTIDMAREAGADIGTSGRWLITQAELEQLVALVRADERAAQPAQPAQKPDIYPEEARDMGLEALAYYTTPPAAQRPWVGLTDEQRTEIRREHYARTLPLMDAVEAKLKEKNT